MPNIASDKITVFPSTRRSAYPHSRLMSEANVVSIVNRFLDTDGFVITDAFNASSGSFEFNLHGYYFNIDSSTLNTIINNLSGDNVYAHIEVVSVGTAPNIFKELYGQDENNEFKGLVIDTSESYTAQNSGEVFTLKLFEKSDGNFVIPSSSKFKFLENSVDFVVDGGLIV